MTVHTAIDAAAGVVTHTVVGDLGIDDFQQAFALRPTLPDFKPGMRVLWDLSQANASRISTDEIRRIAHLNKSHVKKTGVGYKIAFVAPRDIEYGLARMYQMFSAETPVENRVFRTIEEAQRWLSP
ncbi:MAG: hypothetical protein WAU91_06230 [Desulfatitalea sp.]